MTGWLFPVLCCAAGLVLALVRLPKRWRARIDLAAYAALVVLGVVDCVTIALGHYERMDAMWPGLTALLILSRKRDGKAAVSR